MGRAKSACIEGVEETSWTHFHRQKHFTVQFVRNKTNFNADNEFSFSDKDKKVSNIPYRKKAHRKLTMFYGVTPLNENKNTQCVLTNSQKQLYFRRM